MYIVILATIRPNQMINFDFNFNLKNWRFGLITKFYNLIYNQVPIKECQLGIFSLKYKNFNFVLFSYFPNNNIIEEEYPIQTIILEAINIHLITPLFKKTLFDIIKNISSFSSILLFSNKKLQTYLYSTILTIQNTQYLIP